MKLSRLIAQIRLSCYLATLLVSTATAQSSSFRAILEQSDISPAAFSNLSEWPSYEKEDWQTISQVLNRLDQFRDLPAKQADVWLANEDRDLGEIYHLRGQIIAVEKLELPEQIAVLQNRRSLYRYQVQITTEQNEKRATILSSHVPKSWLSKQTFKEPVSVDGVLVKMAKEGQQLTLIADHIAWYPTENAPTGQLLLARLGMDVALLDEVVHRQPFVKASVSREGEAFYETLLAFSKADQLQLAQLASENIALVAERWHAQLPELERNHKALLERLSKATDEKQRAKLQKEMKAAKLQRGLAATVLDRREKGLSAVAPLFLQPEQEVGQLVRFEGTARRAVLISLSEKSDLDTYYEIEVFTTDSQNLPLTCCVTELPKDFPTGDEIREPVEITGVFFKSWRYRSRTLTKSEAGSGQQRQMYSPIVIGKSPIWLKPTSDSRKGGWAFWGGVAFLVGIALLWIVMTWLSRHDRKAKASRNRDEKITL